MSQTNDPAKLRDLVTLLSTLESLYEELGAVVRRKIEAMKRNELQIMRDLNEREHALAGKIRERDGLRRQLMDAVGAQAGWPNGAARDIPLAQLSARLPEPHASALRSARARLAEAAARLANANRTAAEFARAIIEHLTWVFRAAGPAGAAPVTYSAGGSRTRRGETMIVDTVG